MNAEIRSGIAPRGYYHRYYGARGWTDYRDLLGMVMAYSLPGPILDIGSGHGLFLEGAKHWGLPCIGVDGSTEAIDIALERCPGLRIQKHDLCAPLPFEPELFQTVVLNQVIEHLNVDTTRFVLHEAFRMLRAAGVLIVKSPCRYNRHEVNKDPTHVRPLTPIELNKLLIDAGFSKVESFNTPLSFLGKGRVGLGIAEIAFRLLRWDRLSATANARAYKAT